MCQVVMVITVPTVWEQKEQVRVGEGLPRACYGEFALCFTSSPPAQTAPQDFPHREHQSRKWKSKPSSVPQQALRMPRKSWWFSRTGWSWQEVKVSNRDMDRKAKEGARWWPT